MAWRLRSDRPFTHPKTGARTMKTSYHKGYLMGCFPEGTSNPNEACEFRTKKLAEVYMRSKGLQYYGYRPEQAASQSGNARNDETY